MDTMLVFDIHLVSYGEGKAMSETTSYLESLVRETQKPEAEIVARAFQAGLRQLWREQILGRYLRGNISRDKAINLAGIDYVSWRNVSIAQ